MFSRRSLIAIAITSLFSNVSDVRDTSFCECFLYPLVEEEDYKIENDESNPEIEMRDLIEGGIGNKSNNSFKKSVQYSADGSIIVNLDGSSTLMRDNAKIIYDPFFIISHLIDVNFKTQYISARGYRTKRDYYDPRVFTKFYNANLFSDTMKLNFHSQRAKFNNLLLRADDYIVRSDIAKKDIEDTYYLNDVFFTTCILPKPHYGFHIKRLKYRNKKKIVGDRLSLVFNGVEIPFPYMPFGLYIFPKEKHSGFIFPHFGENSNGFYLRDLGYYFYLNDYIDLKLSASVYTKGSYDFKAHSNYIYRYHFKGNLDYQTSHHTKYKRSFNHKNVKKDDDWIFKWQHESLDSKIRKFTIFIDLHGTSPKDSFFVSNLEAKKAQTMCKSTIKYSRQQIFNRLYNLDSTVQYDKNFTTGIVNLTLPLITLSSVPFHPFRFGRKESKYFWDDIETKHDSEFVWKTSNKKNKDKGVVENPYTSKRIKEKKFTKKDKGFEFSWDNRKKILNNSSCGIKHKLPIETNIKILRYFNLKPFINPTLRNYFTRRKYDENTEYIEEHSLYNVWDYNSGATLGTTIYGILKFNPNGKILGLRHKIDPTISFTYTPDLSDDFYGFYQTIHGVKYNRFAGNVYGNASDHRSAVIDIKCDNLLEMQVSDNSTIKIVPLIDSFSWNTGYDLLTPRFGLKDINYEVSTHIDVVSIKYNATIDPYFYEKVNGRIERINDFAWNHNQYLGNIVKSSFIISTSLQSKSLDKKDEKIKKMKEKKKKYIQGKNIENENEDQQGENDIEENFTADDYAPLYFLQNWKVDLDFRHDFSFDPNKNKKKEKNLLNVSTNFQLTKSWKINGSFVVDIDKEKFKHKYTKFGAVCDLHCWFLTFNMVPFAKDVSIDFLIGVKSQMIRDVKIPHTNRYKRA